MLFCSLSPDPPGVVASWKTGKDTLVFLPRSIRRDGCLLYPCAPRELYWYCFHPFIAGQGLIAHLQAEKKKSWSHCLCNRVAKHSELVQKQHYLCIGWKKGCTLRVLLIEQNLCWPSKQHAMMYQLTRPLYLGRWVLCLPPALLRKKRGLCGSPSLVQRERVPMCGHRELSFSSSSFSPTSTRIDVHVVERRVWLNSMSLLSGTKQMQLRYTSVCLI